MDTLEFTGALCLDTENTKYPTPEEYNYWRDIKDRIIWLDEEVTEKTMDAVHQIFRWNKADRGKQVSQRTPIVLVFFSDGGLLDVAHALIDAIRASETPVYGINIGKAHSAACDIFLACHKRYVFPHAQFVVHKGFAGFQGSYNELISAVDAYQASVDAMVEYMAETTKMSTEEIEDHIQTDWYVTAEEAVECGIADEIITSLNEVL